MLISEDSMMYKKTKAEMTRPFHQCRKGHPQSATHSDNKDPGKKKAKTKRNIPQHNKTVRRESGVSTCQYVYKAIHEKPRVSIPLTGENRDSPPQSERREASYPYHIV